jgi:hypothetical protein
MTKIFSRKEMNLLKHMDIISMVKKIQDSWVKEYDWIIIKVLNKVKIEIGEEIE